MECGRGLSVGLLLLAVSIVGWGLVERGKSAPMSDTGSVNSYGRRFSFDSSVLGETREYLLSLPEQYAANPEQYYPVVYLLDGERNFNHLGTLIDFLAGGKMPSMPPAIVVGIVNVDRTRDYTPEPIVNVPGDGMPLEYLAQAGGADRFLAFIEQELAPEIRRRYRTSGLNVVVGHSFGGLLALEALRTRPTLFNGYVILDPSLWYNAPDYAARVRAELKAHPPQVSVFMAAAGEAAADDTPLMQTMLDEQLAFADDIRSHAPSTMDFHFRHYPDENHGSLVHIATHDGLRTLFAGYSIDYKQPHLSLDRLRARYADLSRRFGQPIRPTRAYLDEVAGYVDRNPDPAGARQAVEAFRAECYGE